MSDIPVHDARHVNLEVFETTHGNGDNRKGDDYHAGNTEDAKHAIDAFGDIPLEKHITHNDGQHGDNHVSSLSVGNRQ